MYILNILLLYIYFLLFTCWSVYILFKLRYILGLLPVYETSWDIPSEYQNTQTEETVSSKSV